MAMGAVSSPATEVFVDLRFSDTSAGPKLSLFFASTLPAYSSALIPGCPNIGKESRRLAVELEGFILNTRYAGFQIVCEQHPPAPDLEAPARISAAVRRCSQLDSAREPDLPVRQQLDMENVAQPGDWSATGTSAADTHVPFVVVVLLTKTDRLQLQP